MTNTIYQHIFDNIKEGIISFDRNAKVSLYNRNLLQILQLSEQTPLYQLDLEQFLDILRRKYNFYLKHNFQEYLNELHQRLIQPQYNVLQEEHLLKEQYNLTVKIITQNNTLTMYWIDITNDKLLKYETNNYKTIYHKIISHSLLPTLVIQSNGNIHFYNQALLNELDLTDNIANQHIKTILTQITIFNNTTSEKLLNYITQSRLFTYQFNYDKTQVNIIGIPLNNLDMVLQIQLILSNNSLTSQLSNENLTQWQNQIFQDWRYLINEPLEETTSLLNLMLDGYTGTLNHRQLEYLNTIQHKLDFVQQETQYKEQLIQWHHQSTNTFSEKVNLTTLLYTIFKGMQRNIYQKKLNINLQNEHNLSFIYSNKKLLQQLLTLILDYIIQQNPVNSDIQIALLKSHTSSITLQIQDNIKQPLPHTKDQPTYQWMLINQLLTYLNYELNVSHKMRQYRLIELILININ